MKLLNESLGSEQPKLQVNIVIQDTNLPCFKWKEERANTSYIFQPAWQIRCHDDDWIL